MTLQEGSAWASIAGAIISAAALLFAGYTLLRTLRNASAGVLISLEGAFSQAWRKYLAAPDEAAKDYEFAELANLIEITCGLHNEHSISGRSRRTNIKYIDDVLGLIAQNPDARNRFRRLRTEPGVFSEIEEYVRKRGLKGQANDPFNSDAQQNQKAHEMTDQQAALDRLKIDLTKATHSERLQLLALEMTERCNNRNENLKGALSLAGQVLKSLEWINGAAAAGLLTFYGNVLIKGDASLIDPRLITLSLISFGIGLLAAVIAAAAAYGSQLRVATATIWHNGLVSGEVLGRRAAIAVAALSGLAFAAGLAFAGSAFVVAAKHSATPKLPVPASSHP